jgi:hypothetical protein
MATTGDTPEGVRQLTHDLRGHILTNVGVWSPDGKWIVYDTRSDPAGDVFDGATIEQVNVETGEVRVLYRARNGAHCGVATTHPIDGRVVFILGPERPTPDWEYGPCHRQGMIVSPDRGPESTVPLEARDLVPPYTPGALRGGSHVHVFSPDGQWVSFTYEDHVLSQLRNGDGTSGARDINQRNVGISVSAGPVRVQHAHPRNHDGEYFSILVTRTTAHPLPGSDQITRAFEEGWVGAQGYLRADGTCHRRALAFQGHVTTTDGRLISEVFIVDLPDDPTVPGEEPLQGDETRAPFPPKGTQQRRLTFTADRRFPGLQGPRHWLRSAPDGSRIAFCTKDDAGIAQLWTVSPNGDLPAQLTHNPWPIASAFTWSPDGAFIAHVMDNSVFATDAVSGQSVRLTLRVADDEGPPRPEACVISPDGTQVAFVRNVGDATRRFNQIFVADCFGITARTSKEARWV